MTKTYTIKELENGRFTKEEMFKDMDKTFDYALPQNWLDNFSRMYDLNYHLVRSTTVWIYPENEPVSRCFEVQQAINHYMGKDVAA